MLRWINWLLLLLLLQQLLLMQLLQLLQLLLLESLLQIVVTNGVLALISRLHVLLQHVRLVEIRIGLLPLVQIDLGVGVRQRLAIRLQIVQIQMRCLAERQLDGAHASLACTGFQFGRLIEILIDLRVEDARRGTTTARPAANAQRIREAAYRVLWTQSIRILVTWYFASANTSRRGSASAWEATQQATVIAAIVQLMQMLILFGGADVVLQSAGWALL